MINITNKICNQIRGQFHSQLSGQLHDQLSGELHDQLDWILGLRLSANIINLKA